MFQIAAAQLAKECLYEFKPWESRGKFIISDPKREKPKPAEKTTTPVLGKRDRALVNHGQAHIDFSGHGLQSFKAAAEKNQVLWKELVRTGTAHKNYGWVS